MSLTSYRAALPRDRAALRGVPRVVLGAGDGDRSREIVAFLSRSGGDLLSHVLRRSTIGATALNGRVRDGIGCFARAMSTRSEKKRSAFRRGAGRLSKDAFGSGVYPLPDQIKPIEPLVPVS